MPSRWTRAVVMLAAVGCNAFAVPAFGLPVDCRECHTGSGAPGDGRDLDAYYVQAARHHPSGVPYPAEGAYRLPDGHDADGPFFDRNGNGRAEPDELHLYGGGTGRLECASCHLEHGEGATPADALAAAPPPYLRGDNAASAQCLACHRQ